MEPLCLTPAPADAGARIDSFLAARLDGVTRSAAQKLLENEAVLVNGKAVAKNYKLTGKETVSVTLPEVEDADLIIVMDNGRIADMGTHDELLSRSEIYREVYTQQTMGGKENAEN